MSKKIVQTAGRDQLAKEVWKDEDGKKEEQHGGMFGLGQPNDAYAQYTMLMPGILWDRAT